MDQTIKFEKQIWQTKIKRKRTSWKRRTRGSCEAEASLPKKKNQNSEDPSGSIRHITAHLIHDKNTSIAVPCTVFNVASAGYNPRWIYWSYEFLFFRPRGLRTRSPAQTGPGGQNRGFQRFDPMILCSFFSHNSMNNTRKSQLKANDGL